MLKKVGMLALVMAISTTNTFPVLGVSLPTKPDVLARKSDGNITYKTNIERLNELSKKLKAKLDEERRLEEERLKAEKAERERIKSEKESKNLKLKQEKEAINGQLITVELSFYCICSSCCGLETAICANGQPAVPNYTIAMDSSIPFGTIVNIEGLGERVVMDRGGAIGITNGIYHIDVLVSTHNEALQLGRYRTTAVIY